MPTQTETGDEADATIDAAWRALEAGDPEGARRTVEALDPADANVVFLLAACCRDEGDMAGAVALLRRAAAAEPEWAEPELWLAEILAEDPAAMAEAVHHAARAVDLADEEAEYLSALALKAGLEAEAGDVEAARATLAALPPADVALGDVDATLELADLHLALGDAALARDRLRALLDSAPELADAWHALGCAAAELGDEAEMRTAWKRAWRLDAAPGAGADPAFGPRLSEPDMAAVAEAALAELPARARALLRDVPIVIAELPSEEDVDAGVDPRSLGLFDGTAHPDVSALGGQPGLTQILLYRRNLERIAASDDGLREEIRTTLLHEIGHFFGMDHAALDDAGLA